MEDKQTNRYCIKKRRDGERAGMEKKKKMGKDKER